MSKNQPFRQDYFFLLFTSIRHRNLSTAVLPCSWKCEVTMYVVLPIFFSIFFGGCCTPAPAMGPPPSFISKPRRNDTDTSKAWTSRRDGEIVVGYKIDLFRSYAPPTIMIAVLSKSVPAPGFQRRIVPPARGRHTRKGYISSLDGHSVVKVH